MTYDEIKKWLGDNNYQNSGLRTDRNHRIDLYLSDVLYDFAQQQVKNLNIPDVSNNEVTVCRCKTNRMIYRFEDKDWCHSCGELIKAI
jgi:hypothetical protein